MCQQEAFESTENLIVLPFLQRNQIEFSIERFERQIPKRAALKEKKKRRQLARLLRRKRIIENE